MKRFIGIILTISTLAMAGRTEPFNVFELGNALFVRFATSDPIQVGTALKSYLKGKKLIVQELRARNFIYDRDDSGMPEFTFPNFFKETDSSQCKIAMLVDIQSYLEKHVSNEPDTSTPASQVIALIKRLVSPPATTVNPQMLDKEVQRLFPYPAGHMETYSLECTETLDAAIEARLMSSQAKVWNDARLEEIFPQLEKWAFDIHGVHIRSIDSKSSLIIDYSHTGELARFLRDTKMSYHMTELDAYDELIANAVGRLVTGDDHFVDVGAYNVSRLPLLVLAFGKYEKQGFVLTKEIMFLEGKLRAVFAVRRGAI